MTELKVPAADQTLRILSLLARSRGPMPASMIATQLELPRSTVYHLLATLQRHGFVMHLPEEKRYGLGIAAVELSSAYERQEPLGRLGRPLIAQLVDRLGQSCHLAVPHGRDVLYVIEERAPGALRLVTDVDVRLPMQLTASGRAILAALPKAQVRALFPDKEAFVQRHEGARGAGAGAAGAGAGAGGAGAAGSERIDRYSKLRTVLDETRTRGYALEHGSVTAGLASIGVPVLDHRGWPVAAIAVTFLEDHFAPDQFAGVARAVQQAAQTLSARIYGRARP